MPLLLGLRITWNLSNRMLACGTWLRVELRKGFHMSITASRTRVVFAAASRSSLADEMRGSATHPQTAALFPSPIHAKFLSPGKLCKALRPSWT